MLLRTYSLVLITVLISLSSYLVWLLGLPLQPGFSYDLADARFVLVEYANFIFLVITTLTIVLIINRTWYQKALLQESLGRFDRGLYRVMFNLPLVLICLQCACILFTVFAISMSI